MKSQEINKNGITHSIPSIFRNISEKDEYF